MNNHRIQSIAASLLLILILMANLQPASMPLSRQDLSNRHGVGFWNDPCTWDGFFVGAGTVLCATGSAGGCVTAIVGLIRAIRTDKCL